MEICPTLNDHHEGIDSKYYSINNFNEIHILHKFNFGTLHLNITSIIKHFDKLHDLLYNLRFKFSVIGLTEHKIKHDHPAIANIDIPGYSFIYNPTYTSHGV